MLYHAWLLYYILTEIILKILFFVLPRFDVQLLVWVLEHRTLPACHFFEEIQYLKKIISWNEIQVKNQ